MLDLLLIEWVISNSIEDHPQLSHNKHPMDGALVGVGSLWSFKGSLLQGFSSPYILRAWKF
jgi:hypothetical protein